MSGDGYPSSRLPDTHHAWLWCGCGGKYRLPDAELPVTVLWCHYHRQLSSVRTLEALTAPPAVVAGPVETQEDTNG